MRFNPFITLCYACQKRIATETGVCIACQAQVDAYVKPLVEKGLLRKKSLDDAPPSLDDILVQHFHIS